MADIIRDCKNRVICYGDAMTGMVENKYKSQILKMYIPIGGNLSIKRDDTMTYFFYPSMYLATINNLGSPVTKTADKTMKVTYIIQEHEN